MIKIKMKKRQDPANVARAMRAGKAGPWSLRLALRDMSDRYKRGATLQAEKRAYAFPPSEAPAYPPYPPYRAGYPRGYPAYPGFPAAAPGGPVKIEIVGAPIPTPEAPAGPEKKKVGLEFVGRPGISLAELAPRPTLALAPEEEVEEKGIVLRYPLTPSAPKKGERVYAWADVAWDDAEGMIVYKVTEPPLDEKDRRELERIRSIVEEKIELRFEAIKEEQAVDYLKNMIDDIINLFGIHLSPEKREIYEYYIFRDFIGLGKVQAIMNDANIEDISCDGFGVPIFIYHRDPRIGSVRTNIAFERADDLDAFVMKLAQRCRKSVSVAEPILEGSLPDGSRVEATLGTDIARRGSNFTVRKFISEPLTPIHMINFGSLDSKLLAYLWFCIEHNASVLVSGPTASGKTSLLNALSLFIRPALKIVSIEDTPELRLPHANWVPEVARPGFGVTATGVRIGEISMFDLLKASLRQRPDYIIVGEVRGQEAFVLFQQMAVGHAGMSTLHADSLDKIIDRLTTAPISLPANLLETINIIVFIKHMRFREREVRRVTDVIEIEKYDIKEKRLISSRIFKWDPANDIFGADQQSVLLSKIAETYGLSEDRVKTEILNRIRVLDWLKERNITYYKDVGRIFALYYSDPARVMAAIEAGSGI